MFFRPLLTYFSALLASFFGIFQPTPLVGRISFFNTLRRLILLLNIFLVISIVHECSLPHQQAPAGSRIFNPRISGKRLCKISGSRSFSRRDWPQIFIPVFYQKSVGSRDFLFTLFIGPRSDHSLPMSVTDSLTDSLTTLLKIE